MGRAGRHTFPGKLALIGKAGGQSGLGMCRARRGEESSNGLSNEYSETVHGVWSRVFE